MTQCTCRGAQALHVLHVLLVPNIQYNPITSILSPSLLLAYKETALSCQPRSARMLEHDSSSTDRQVLRRLACKCSAAMAGIFCRERACLAEGHVGLAQQLVLGQDVGAQALLRSEHRKQAATAAAPLPACLRARLLCMQGIAGVWHPACMHLQRNSNWAQVEGHPSMCSTRAHASADGRLGDQPSTCALPFH